MRSGRAIVLCVLLALAVFIWLRWRDSFLRHKEPASPALTIQKQPVIVRNHTFDPNAPPADMPALAYGEEAACDSNFLSDTNVGADSLQSDPSHATVTITKIKMVLELSVNIWVPTNVTPHIVEHENGHRAISEDYYRTADQLAARIAAEYLGRKIDIHGSDLDAEFNKALQQTVDDINHEYAADLNPGPAQQYYDSITDHGRNDSDVQGSVAAALANLKISSSQPAPISEK